MTEDGFVFYVIDYYATGEGRTIFLVADRVYDEKSKDYLLESIEKWIGSYYIKGLEAVTKEKFFGEYGHLVPETIAKMILNRQAPGLSFKQEFHFSF